jgi:hypothetical protein
VHARANNSHSPHTQALNLKPTHNRTFRSSLCIKNAQKLQFRPHLCKLKRTDQDLLTSPGWKYGRVKTRRVNIRIFDGIHIMTPRLATVSGLDNRCKTATKDTKHKFLNGAARAKKCMLQGRRCCIYSGDITELQTW